MDGVIECVMGDYLPYMDLPEIEAAAVLARYQGETSRFFRGTSKPYVRWWWLSGPFTHEDIRAQLEWVRQAGFGGVELAWIYPNWLDEGPEGGSRPLWLGEQWSELVAFTKRTAQELELGCDFTFGSCWPFGGSWLEPGDTAQSFSGASAQRIRCSWEQEEHGPVPVLNHLSAAALGRYAGPLLAALKEALGGDASALFCDSLELESERISRDGFPEDFARRFGYELPASAEELERSLASDPDIRYDYRKLVAEIFEREFIEPFAELARRNRAYARVQCHGAPTDLLRAYAAVDVPESEALLFAPRFSRIAASAAAWDGKPIVSAETFTCIYGFPGWSSPESNNAAETYWRKENVADLKLLADGLFAEGVNQIVWHGMPFQPSGYEIEFYASVHVAPDSAFAPELPDFNRYLEQISGLMRLGTAYGGWGVYLPFEDALMADRIPEEEITPGAHHCWEMRHAAMPTETEGYHPVWISHAFLAEAQMREGKICSRALALDGVFVDCEWIDGASLAALARLAGAGAQLVLKRRPKEPGHARTSGYQANLDILAALPNVLSNLNWSTEVIKGEVIPTYWARVLGDDLLVFFAHPATKELKYPMAYGSGLNSDSITQKVKVQWQGNHVAIKLQFQPFGSLMVLLTKGGTVHQVRVDLGSTANEHVINNQHQDGTNDGNEEAV